MSRSSGSAAERFVHIEEVPGSNPGSSTMDYKKPLFLLIWLLVLAVGPVTIFLNTTINLQTLFANQPLTINLFQRLAGLVAFSMIFSQIVIGANMQALTQKFGAWVFKLHLAEGAFAYFLVLLHPLLFVLFNFKIKGVFDPFYVFTDLCVLCETSLEYFYNFGRVSFWVLTIAVLAAKFRTHPLLRNNWRKFHMLNYLVFFMVSGHAYKLGSDISFQPFSAFFWASQAVVVFLVIRRVISVLPGTYKGTPLQARDLKSRLKIF